MNFKAKIVLVVFLSAFSCFDVRAMDSLPENLHIVLHLRAGEPEQHDCDQVEENVLGLSKSYPPLVQAIMNADISSVNALLKDPAVNPNQYFSINDPSADVRWVQENPLAIALRMGIVWRETQEIIRFLFNRIDMDPFFNVSVGAFNKDGKLAELWIPIIEYPNILNYGESGYEEGVALLEMLLSDYKLKPTINCATQLFRSGFVDTSLGSVINIIKLCLEDNEFCEHINDIGRPFGGGYAYLTLLSGLCCNYYLDNLAELIGQLIVEYGADPNSPSLDSDFHNRWYKPFAALIKVFSSERDQAGSMLIELTNLFCEYGLDRDFANSIINNDEYNKQIKAAGLYEELNKIINA